MSALTLQDRCRQLERLLALEVQAAEEMDARMVQWSGSMRGLTRTNIEMRMALQGVLLFAESSGIELGSMKEELERLAYQE